MHKNGSSGTHGGLWNRKCAQLVCGDNGFGGAISVSRRLFGGGSSVKKNGSRPVLVHKQNVYTKGKQQKQWPSANLFN